jgi:eukaryotic-like serine/threonine-protein kinase
LDTVPRVLLQSRFDNFAMTLTPDGRWLAYVSDESGANEVYVRPFPNVDSARFAISVAGGVKPLWRRDGAELFFRTTCGEVCAVPVTTGQRFVQSAPRLLFSKPGLALQEYFRTYDVHPDGKRFLMLASGGVDARTLNVVFNWRAELQSLKEAPQ